eukprot:COSAG01_NODE_6423_length_3674_cov_26.761399_2_plen_196_part_00
MAACRSGRHHHRRPPPRPRPSAHPRRLPTDDEPEDAEANSGDESEELSDADAAVKFLDSMPPPLPDGRQRDMLTGAKASVVAPTTAATTFSPAKTRTSSLSLLGSRADLSAALADLVLVESFASAPGVTTLVTSLPAQEQLQLLQTLKQQGLCIAPSNVMGAGAGLFTSPPRFPGSRLRTQKFFSHPPSSYYLDI